MSIFLLFSLTLRSALFRERKLFQCVQLSNVYFFRKNLSRQHFFSQIFAMMNIFENVNSVKDEPEDLKPTSNHLNGVNDEVTYTQYESELQMKVSVLP